MDSDRLWISPLGRERPLVTAVVLPGDSLPDRAALDSAVQAEALPVDVRVLWFARASEAARVEAGDGTIVVPVPDDVAADHRQIRRRAVLETTGDVYRFIGGGSTRRWAAGLAERLTEARVARPAVRG